jgi:uncharacterized membrane protein
MAVLLVDMLGPRNLRQTALGGLALVGGAVVASALAWPSLPAEMTIHWDASGTADGDTPRAVGAVFLPAVALGILALLLALPRIDPLGSNIEQFREAYDGFVLLMMTYLVGVHGIVLAVNLGYDVPVETLVVGASGLLFVYVGLLLRVAEPNWFVGIRTPWTLSSETVWERVHQIGGTLFVALGVGTLLASVLGVALDVPWLGVAVLTAGSLAVALGTVGYSYYLYEKLDQPADTPARSRG